MKRELTIDNVFEIEPYRSILNLLIRFQKHGEHEGLKQSHFRYALINNHGNLNPYLEERMRQFYIWTDGINTQDALTPLISTGRISSNCITSRSNLSNKLKKLKSLGVIHKDQRGKKDRYKITRDCRLKGLKITFQKDMDEYSNMFAYKDNSLLFGLSTDMFYKFDVEHRSKILDKLRDIDSKLEEIREIKLTYMIKEWLNILISKDIKDEVQFTVNLIKEISEGKEDFSELESEYLKLVKKYELDITYAWSSLKHINPLEKMDL